MSDLDLTFDGTGAMGTDTLVRTIRIRTLADGTHKDDYNTAQLAATYFVGSALLWYEELSEDVQDSWKLLRRALLNRWPPSGAGASPVPPAAGASFASSRALSSFAPEPAAAAAAAAAPPPSSSAAALGRGPFLGRILVLELNGLHCGYLGAYLDKNGHYEVVSSSDQAVHVRFVATNTTGFTAEIVNGEGSGQVMGMTWARNKQGSHADWGGIAALPRATLTGSTSKLYSGASIKEIWDVSLDGRVTTSYEADRQGRRYLIGALGRTLNLTINFDEFIKGAVAAIKTVKFIFEPI